MPPYENPLECDALTKSTYLAPADHAPEQPQVQDAGGHPAHQNDRRRMPVGPPPVPTSSNPSYVAVHAEPSRAVDPGSAGAASVRGSSTTPSTGVAGPLSSTRSTSSLVRTASAPVLFEGVDPADLITSVDYYLFNQNEESAVADGACNSVRPFVPTAPRSASVMSVSGEITVQQPQELLLHLLMSDNRPTPSAPLESIVIESCAHRQVDRTVVEGQETNDADGTAAARSSTMLYPGNANGDNSLADNSDGCKLHVFLTPPSPPSMSAHDPPTFTWPPPPTNVDDQPKDQQSNREKQHEVGQADRQPEDPEADQQPDNQ